ncbi:hypothetical protein BC941DRAFT_420569, partial [Chlamydoabsidia padenii]
MYKISIYQSCSIYQRALMICIFVNIVCIYIYIYMVFIDFCTYVFLLFILDGL